MTDKPFVLGLTETGGAYLIHFKGRAEPAISISKDSDDGRQLERLGLVGLPSARLVEIARELKAEGQRKTELSDAQPEEVS